MNKKRLSISLLSKGKLLRLADSALESAIDDWNNIRHQAQMAVVGGDLFTENKIGIRYVDAESERVILKAGFVPDNASDADLQSLADFLMKRWKLDRRPCIGLA
jgi:hypothetical protein